MRSRASPLRQAEEAVTALRFPDDARVEFGGRTHVLASLYKDADDDPWHPVPTVRLAARLLYDEWYSGVRDAAPAGRTANLSAPRPPEAKVTAGWNVQDARPDGSLSATRDVTAVDLLPGEYLRAGGAGRLEASDEVLARHGGGGDAFQPGWIYRMGQEPADAITSGAIVRLYFHVTAGGAADFIDACGALDHRRVPFRAKVGAVLSHRDRTDAAVIYASSRHVRALAEPIAEIYGGLRAQLDPATPPLARRLAPGLAMAEGARDGSSFGVGRCRLLGELAFRLAQEDAEESELPTAIATAFEGAGLDPARPYLQGAADFHGLDEAADEITELLRDGAPR